MKLEFETVELDETGWVQNFGGLKEVKSFLEGTFDHTCVVAEDDPKLELFLLMQTSNLMRIVILPAVGCERFAEYIFNHIDQNFMVSNSKAYLKSVEVREHQGNSAKVIRHG